MQRRTPARHGAPRPPSAGQRGAAVQLAWALDRSGAKVPVAAIDPKDRSARGPFSCLACGEPLVPHLGKVRARHFAHLAGSACPLTAPETALHLNAKERLLWLAAEAFAGRLRVTVLARCPSCRRLAPRDLAGTGDAAVGEGAVGPLRADVLVLARGRPALAVEVKVTHAVEPEKEAALAAAGVPAVELDAREEWEREGPGGAVELVCSRTLGFPPCPACAALARADADRAQGGEAAEIAELEAYRARGLLVPRPLDSRPGPAARPEPVEEGAGATEGAARPEPVEGGAGATKGAAHPEPVEGGAGATKGAAHPEPVEGGAAMASKARASTGSARATRAATAPLTPEDRASLAAAFRCPDCGSTALQIGARLARHPCARQGLRPVAWRGYDGSVVVLGWWRPDARRGRA